MEFSFSDNCPSARIKIITSDLQTTAVVSAKFTATVNIRVRIVNKKAYWPGALGQTTLDLLQSHFPDV